MLFLIVLCIGWPPSGLVPDLGLQAAAYLAGNLDPAFPILTAFEQSMSVGTDATEADLCGHFDIVAWTAVHFCASLRTALHATGRLVGSAHA